MNQPTNTRVLIVDDYEDIGVAMSLLLYDLGYEAMYAKRTDEALSLVAQWRPRCVILDVFLQLSSGVDLARAIRSQQGEDVLLIAMSGATPEVNRDVWEACQIADHFLPKPIRFTDLEPLLPRLSHCTQQAT